MEVTKSNFEEIFPEIVKDIRSATFICIDGEFTGLENGSNVTNLDTPEDCYLKIRAGSLDFLFIQFGLSIFFRDEKSGQYKNRTYVFYLFPWHRNSLAPDTRFLCQTSSINFLVSNNFDFNKLFKEGIPYLNATDETYLADAMKTRREYQAQMKNESPSQPAIPIPKQYKETVDNAMKKIEQVVTGLTEEVKLGKMSSFVRKLIYQSFEQKHGKTAGVVLRSASGEMICSQGEPEDREALDTKEVEAAVGFSRVVREISNAGCLVVGHNMLLDLCHLIHRFMDPLPPDYPAFKEMVHSLFPRLVDTKFITRDESLSEALGLTTLEGLMETLSKPPFHLPDVDCAEGYSYQGESCQLHNAGYDAYLTGVVFLALVRALDPDNKKSNIINCRPLEKFINKIPLTRIFDSYIDLLQPDPVPVRDHVFHMSFPSSWTPSDISKVFAPFGSVSIRWINDTSAWVSLYQKSDSGRAQAAFKDPKSLPSGVAITPYHRYMEDRGKVCSSSNPNKRKATSSPPAEKKHKSSTSNNLGSSNGRTKKQSPKEDPSKAKESGIKMLEKAVVTGGGVFETSDSWD